MKEALAAGHTEPLYHALTRPPEAEGEATNRAIQLAHLAGAPLYVVHVTCKEAVEPIARARDNGWDVWGETCTQYFFNSLDDIAKPNFEGAKYVYSPPRARRVEPGRAVERGAHRRALGDLDRPLRVPLRRAEDARQGRLLEDPERRPGAREPAADDPRVRRARRADLAQPDGRAARDEPGAALRPLSAQGHGRRRLRRRPRRLRSGEAGDDLRGDPALEGRTTTSTRARR